MARLRATRRPERPLPTEPLAWDAADVVVLTALQLEYDAVLDVEAGGVAGSGWTEELFRDLPVARRELVERAGRPLRVVVVRAPDMGKGSALTTLQPLVDHLRPSCVAMCGVCAGRPGKTRLGDVVVGERLFDHDAGKQHGARDGDKQQSARSEADVRTYSLPAPLKIAAERFDPVARFAREEWWRERPRPHDWQERWVLDRLADGVADPRTIADHEVHCGPWDEVIERLWASGDVTRGTFELTTQGRARVAAEVSLLHRDFPDLSAEGRLLPFTLHVAPIGSGSAVVEDERVWGFVSTHMRKLLAIEMEASALADLVRSRPRHDPLDAVVMKGVMDFANHGRDDHFKDWAARASAECLLAFLRDQVWSAAPTPAPLPEVDRRKVDAWREFGRRRHARIRVISANVAGPGTSGSSKAPSPNYLVDVVDAFVPLYVRFGGQRGHESHLGAETPVTIDEAIGAATDAGGQVRMALLGEPASGKTTILRHLFGRLAPYRSGAATTTGANVAADRPARVPAQLAGLHPLLVKLSSITKAEYGEDEHGTIDRAARERGLEKVVRRVAHEEGYEPAAEALLAHEQRRFLFLLDGLDEIRDADRRLKVIDALRCWVDHWPDSAFVVTSRVAQWADTPKLADRFPCQVYVRGLSMGRAGDPDTRTPYVHNWFRVVNDVENRNLPAAERRTAAQVDADAREQTAAFLAELATPAWTRQPKLAELTANPLTLSTLCALHHAKTPLPHRRVDVFDAALRMWIETRPDDKREDEGVAHLPLSWASVRPVLEPLAYRSQEGEGRALPLAEAAKVVDGPLRQANGIPAEAAGGERFLALLRDDRGILESDDAEHIAFAHLQFREYLAAGDVARRQLGRALAARLTPAAQATHWRETILLAAQLDGVFVPFLDAALTSGALDGAAGAGVWALVRDFVREAVAARDGRGVGADELPDGAALVRVVKRQVGRARREQGWLGQLARWLLRRLGRRTGRPPGGSLRTLLGLLGGYRLPALADAVPTLMAGRDAAVRDAAQRLAGLAAAVAPWQRGKPFFEPVTGMSLLWISTDTFTIGSSDQDTDADEDEKPAHPVKITSGYWMGEHPVTNAQYRGYVEATGRVPGYWDDRRFNDPEQPVVGVSWHDAMTFCSWLNAYVPPEVEVRFRLPTEAEWEYAAGGTDGRKYPWGDQPPSATLATFGLDYPTGRPSVVGQHPTGKSPFGLHDMAGNVWEWCLDAKRTYQGEAPVTDPGLDDVMGDVRQGPDRVLRGGAWRSDGRLVRAASRHAYAPDNAYDNLGFRLAGGQSAPR